jgi:hypothetical protein
MIMASSVAVLVPTDHSANPALNPQLAALVPQIAACAQAKLPHVNGRLTKAQALVLAGAVQPSPMVQGGWRVQSQGRDTAYEVHDHSCTCPNYQYRHVSDPEMVCAHILATWLYRRAAQQVAHHTAAHAVGSVSSVEPVTSCDSQPVTGPVSGPVDISHLPSIWEALGVPRRVDTPTPAPLPEAPASVNVRLVLHGRDCQITLRDSDEARLLERLEALLQRFPVEASTAPAADVPVVASVPPAGWCGVHRVQMRQNTKAGHTWFSHKMADGQWCKGY